MYLTGTGLGTLRPVVTKFQSELTKSGSLPVLLAVATHVSPTSGLLYDGALCQT